MFAEIKNKGLLRKINLRDLLLIKNAYIRIPKILGMRNIYLLICVLLSMFAKSQTIFWAEGFGNGTSCSTDQGFLLGDYSDGLGTWNSNTFSVTLNGTYANIWYVSETEGGRNVGDCGNSCLDSAGLLNRTMHIGNVPSSPHSALCPTGDCGALYDVGIGNGQVVTDIRAESPTISCLGKTTIFLGFNYILRGDTAHDYLTVWYSDGSTWTQLGKPVPTATCINSSATAPVDTEGVWATQIYPLPASANNNGAVKIGFNWVNNDDGIGSNPSVAIDNITLASLSTAPLPTTLTVTIIPPTTNTLYCTGIPYYFTGNANPGPITFYDWSSVSSTTVNAQFNPSPAWQNGEAITFPEAGTYTLTLKCNSQNNGVNDTTFVVTVAQTPTITVTPPNPFVCSGGTTGVDLYASGALTYTWTNAPTTIPPTYIDPNADTVNVNPQTLTPPAVFNYSVTGTAVDGCLSNQVVATVTVIAAPTPYYSPNDTICVGTHTNLYVDSMPITTVYTWTATSTHAGLGSNSGPFVEATPIYFNYSNSQNDTTVTYQVLINLPGCPAYQPHTFEVLVLPLPHVNVTADTIGNCNNRGDTLKAVTIPSTNVTLSWVKQGSSTVVPPYSGNTNEVIVNPTVPTKYYVIPTNQFGCNGAKDSVLVLLGDTVNASITSEYSIICFGQNDVLTAYPQNPPQLPNKTPYYYTWGALSGGPANVVDISPSGDTVLVAPTQNTIYTVSVHGVCVLNNVAQASIQVNQCTTPIPVLTLSTHTICVGHCITYKDSTQYTSTKPLTYTFVFVGADQPHGHIYPPSGNSSVSGDTLFYTTTGSAPLNPFKVCYYVNSKLNENDTAHQVFGYYPVTEIVMNGAGQDSILIDSIQVYNGPTAVANGHHIVTIDQGDSTTLCSNVLGSSSTTVTATTYNWAQPDSSFINCPNCPCAVVTPSATTQYTLTLTDASGCVSSDTISVIVDIICTNIFVANAFTPNGDGLNDVLHVKTNCPLTNMSFKIFDRWGELVFQSTDESVGWDGTYKGKPMDMAVFMYTVNGFLSNGKEAKKKGNVTLLR